MAMLLLSTLYFCFQQKVSNVLCSFSTIILASLNRDQCSGLWRARLPGILVLAGMRNGCYLFEHHGQWLKRFEHVQDIPPALQLEACRAQGQR